MKGVLSEFEEHNIIKVPFFFLFKSREMQRKMVQKQFEVITQRYDYFSKTQALLSQVSIKNNVRHNHSKHLSSVQSL